MSTHREVFRVVANGISYVTEGFDTYEEALAYGLAKLDRFRIEKMYVRK